MVYIYVYQRYGTNPNYGLSAYNIRNGVIQTTGISANFAGISDIYLSYNPTSIAVEDIFNTYDLWVSTDNISYEPYTEKGKWYDEQKIGEDALGVLNAWDAYLAYNSGGGVGYCYVVNNSNFSTGIQKSICTHFKNVNYVYLSSTGYIGAYCDHPNLTLSRKYFISNIANLTDFKAWLTANNVRLQYELATPIITEITDTSTIEALENIRLYSGVTNITSDAPIQITYYEKDKFNIDKYTINDYLTYIDLNNIEKFVKGLSNIHLRNYTKTTWNLGDVITSIAFQNIENELSYYNTLYDLDYTMKNWEIASRNGTQVITYMDINRWLDIIIDVINKL